MKTNTINLFLTLVIALAGMVPAMSHAWWNPDWSARSKITLDTSDGAAATREAVAQVPVLIRLHTGNFDFTAAMEDGADIRFVAADDKTALKYHIEKFDSLNELALIWVQAPKLDPASKTQSIWMYYGNDKAAASDDSKGTYDINQTADYHFAETNSAPKDATGYGNNATQSDGTFNSASLIGHGLTLNGSQSVSIPVSASLKLASSSGFTFTAWVKVAGPQQNALLFSQDDGANAILIGIDQDKVYASIKGGTETPRTATLTPNAWHHIAVTAGNRLVVYVDGQEAGSVDAVLPDMQGAITIGRGLAGEMDEVTLSNTARSADWIKLAAKGQGPDSAFASIGQEEDNGGGGETSYFGTILHSVTLDGWVVIGLLVIMAFISWVVMAAKGMAIGQMEKGNSTFLAAFRKNGTSNGTSAVHPEQQGKEQTFLQLPGGEETYKSSSLYRIYGAGMSEIGLRFSNGAPKILTPAAIDVIKARLDAALVRENQKLNSLMVLLTIAISGGPFLGLLGTVVGVMITFAAIAATGDVNIAAIAPGIAAALVATVAGLAVAIPALFGYNYLGSKIKNITADMHVFVDEMITRLAENYEH